MNTPTGVKLVKPTSGYTNYSITGLSKGTHTIQVQNGSCYSDTKIITLNAPGPLAIVLNGTTDVSCHDGTDGRIDFSISGGIGSFTVELLSNGVSVLQKSNHARASTDNYFDGLSAGTYQLKVTDAANVIYTNNTPVTLTQPGSPISLGATVTKISWPGAGDGEVVLSANGGNGGYQYRIGSGAFSPTLAFSNLSRGIYTFDVQDAKGCQAAQTVTLNDPVAIQLSSTPTTATCNLNDGTLKLTLTGGWADFAYEVKLTQGSVITTKEFTVNATPREVTFPNLSEGNYSVEAYVKGKTANKTAQSGSIPMYNPLAVISYNMGTLESCAGKSDASITLTNLSGSISGSYTFVGGGVLDKATGVVSHLTSQAYTFTLTETTGRQCSHTVSVPFGTIRVHDTPLKLLTPAYTPANATCEGAQNGSLTIHASGGFAPLTYQIVKGSDTDNNTNGWFPSKSSGTWAVTVTDNKGCVVATDAVIAANPNPVNQLTATPVNQSCAEIVNGAIQLSGLGHSNGKSLYLFLNGDAKGSPNSETQSLGPLASGFYEVKVSDSDGCTQSKTVTITDLNHRPAVTKDDIELLACATASNGAVRITATASYGSSEPFNFAFTGGHPGKTETQGATETVREYGRLNKNSYTVTVTDAIGCATSYTGTVPLSPDPVKLQLGDVVRASCQAANNGEAKLLATGGKPSAGGYYSYSFPGQTNQIAVTAHFKGIAANATAYSATVADSEGCTAGISVPVGIIASPFGIKSVTIDPPLCHDDANASISISANDWKNQPYTYQLKKTDGTVAYEGITSSTIMSGFAGGIYHLYMLSPDNCPGEYPGLVIPNPEPVTVTVDSFKVLDKGLATGKVEVALSNGSGTYVYSFSDQGMNTPDQETSNTQLSFDGLKAGVYFFTLKDKNNCPYFGSNDPTVFADTVTIAEPSEHLAIEVLEHTDVQCYGYGNGIIRATGTGGWSNDGTYRYRLGESGVWTSELNRHDLSPGSYHLFLKDDEGVERGLTLEITEPAKLSLTVDATKDATCTASGNGWIKASSLNGLPFDGGLRYRIATADGNTELDVQTRTGIYYFGQLPKGNYKLEVSDSHQCTDAAAFAIGAPDTVTITTHHNYIRAKGDATGQLDATISKGNGMYDYRWFRDESLTPFRADQATEGTLALENLTAGLYRLELRDTADCRYEGREWMVRLFDIREPELSLGLVALQTDSASCHGLSDGSVLLQPSGGWGNYSFRMNDGSFGNSIRYGGLPTGNYLFTVRDSAGVEYSLPVDVAQPDPLVAGVDHLSHLLCHEDGKGTIALDVTGGNGGYQVSTDNAFFVPGTTVNGLQAGSYVVYVRDRKGCHTHAASQTLMQPDKVTNPLFAVTESRCQNREGAIQAGFTGGTGTLAYQWSYDDGGVELEDKEYYGEVGTFSTPSIERLYSGRYLLTVTDGNLCPFTFSYQVNDISDLVISHIATDSVKCHGDANGRATATVIDGNSPYYYHWDAKVANHENENAWGLAADGYSLMVTDSKGCRTSKAFSIPTPAPLSYQTNAIVHPLCLGGQTGSIDVTATGGSPSYAYLWDTGETSISRANLLPGTYTLTITDHHLCQASFDFTLAYQRTIKPDIGPDANICHYQTHAIDGGGYHTYSWQGNNGFSSALRSVTLSDPGQYVLQVRDADQCIGSDTMRLNVSYLRIDKAVKSDVTCHGFANGQASIEVLPLEWPYRTEWSNREKTTSIANLSGGIYDVAVFDDYGCTDTRQLNVYEPDPLSLASWVKDPLCHGVPNGSIQIEASGGNGGYNYLWHPNGQGVKLTKLDQGSYTLTLSDAKNCSLERFFSLAYQRQLWPYLGNDVTLCAGNSVKLYPGNFDGYQWFQNGTKVSADTALVLNTSSTVAVRVNDADGCLAYDTTHVSLSGTTFSPLFLTASSVAIGDTLLLVEVSNPKPVFVSWQASLPHKVVEETQYACKVVFEETGNAEVKLTAFNGDCQGESWKHVLVVPKSELAEGEDEPVAFSKIASLGVSPNPNRGEFNASLTLVDALPATLYLVNVGTGQIVETRRLSGLSQYNEPFAIQATPGHFALFAECAGERRVAKIVVY
ncbi:MAG: SprB repeat-containing protein [Breznakibacter sp.]